MLDRFSKLHIAVIGDVILDEYIQGHINRLSPEAPVPVLDFQKREFRPGGAANVALNLFNLGVRTSLVSVIGDDLMGTELKELVSALNLNGQTILLPLPGRVTTCKTRVMAQSQHIVRIDHEEHSPVSDAVSKIIINSIIEIHSNTPLDAVILQDYEKGVFHLANIPVILSELKKAGIPIIVDPKDKNFWLYKGVEIFKPNRSETERALGKQIVLTADGLKAVSTAIESRLENKVTIITLSESGVYLHEDGKSVWHLAPKQEIVDVCGAGDAVISITAAAWCAGYSLNDIALLSNIAGSIVCAHPGVKPIIGSELEMAYLSNLK